MKKERRIKKNEEFQQMIHEEKHVSSNLFVVYYKPKVMEYNRVGISASKKMGNAVERNKIKRQLRMMVQETDCLSMEQDVLLLVRKAYLENDYSENKKGLESILKKVRMRAYRDQEGEKKNEKIV
ncbi:MAG: ribonuclease P protein component [Erysipelotrichaceae bacterium]|nr:ribonuclease P protein component [Erysipelotrichaceae bacterium]